MASSSFYLYTGFDKKAITIRSSQKGTLKLREFERQRKGRSGRAAQASIKKSCFWATKQSPTHLPTLGCQHLGVGAGKKAGSGPE